MRPVPKLLRISPELQAYARRRHSTVADAAGIFAPAKPPPGVGPANSGLAMDEAVPGLSGWAGSWSGVGVYGGFLGYPVLAELAQRPEFRRVTETIASEMTREWIELKSSGDDDKSAKIKALNDALTHYAVQSAFRKVAEGDGFFGRGHLYIDTGATDRPEELLTSIGDGRDKVSLAKIKKGSLKAIRPVEAMWCYPQNYGTNDPLSADWYWPEIWYVMAKRVHATRLLTFIGREVPDLLKPAYAFGGLSLTQMV
ncbi:MAG: DUF1073 domain-containing protein, partial [Patescibacteria group bacterium]|nr:DUF1073 domain-containing protein [Patescibacteria group bacterium]